MQKKIDRYRFMTLGTQKKKACPSVCLSILDLRNYFNDLADLWNLRKKNSTVNKSVFEDKAAIQILPFLPY